MTDGRIALLISLLSVLLGAIYNYHQWRRRAEFSEFRQELLDRIEGKYVPRETYVADQMRIDERCLAHGCCLLREDP